MRRAAISLIAALVAPATAAAQTAPPEPKADDVKRLYEEGEALGLKGDYSGALAKFQAAADRAESPGLRYSIAYCEEHLGRLLAAISDYRLALREAARFPNELVTTSAPQRIAAIEPRIATLHFERPPDAAGAAILVDGTRIVDPSHTDVDPGKHHVTAMVDGYQRFDATVAVGNGETRDVTLALTPLPKPSPVAGYVIGAFGITSLAAMGVFIGLRQSTVASLENQCVDLLCNQTAQNQIDRGRLFTGLAETTAIVGAVAIGAGLYLVLKSPSNARPPATSWRASVTASGVRLGGSF